MEKQEVSDTSIYDAALSFAGEDRDFVERVRGYLERYIRIFYDYNEKGELASKYLPAPLEEIYSKKARYGVVFISKFYKDSKWANFELQCMLAREINEPDYIIPVRLDDTEIPGVLHTKGFIDATKESPENIANIIVKKVRPNTLSNLAIMPSVQTTNNKEEASLIVVEWRVTSDCDHKCCCCFGPKKIASMDIESAKKLIDILHEHDVKTVCITGGEPLKHPHIDEILEYLNTNGFIIYLSTNGDYFDQHRKAIESYVGKLSLSLDGYSEETHSRFGRNPGNFKKVISILDYYRDHRPPFQIKVGTLLSSNNINAPSLLFKIFNVLENSPIDIWKIYELLPEGEARYDANPCKCDKEIFDLVIEKFEYERVKSSPHFQIFVSRRWARSKAYFIIQPDGTVIVPEDVGEVVEERNIGNLLEEPMDKIVDKWGKLADYSKYKNNLRIRYLTSENYPRRLGYKEEAILKELANDPAQTSARISKATRIPPDEVDMTIKSLHERGILKSIMPIINVSRLGLSSFNIFISLDKADDVNKEQIIENLKKHPSIPWVATANGKWDFVIAIFANPRRLTLMMADINAMCRNKIRSYDLLVVYEQYTFGQRYLFKRDKERWVTLNGYWMPLDEAPASSLSTKDFEVLAKVTGYKQPYLFDFSMSYGSRYKEISEDVVKFKNLGILFGFIPTCDIYLLGYEWYLILIRLKNLTDAKLLEFKKFIAQFPQVVYILCGIGDWDIQIEIHADSASQVHDIIRQVYNRYCAIIVRHEIIRMIKEHKYDYCIGSVFEGRMQT